MATAREQQHQQAPLECHDFAPHLETLLDGELNGHQLEFTLRHLQRCTACQRGAEHAKRYREAMRRAHEADRAEPELLARMRMRVRHATSTAQPPR